MHREPPNPEGLRSWLRARARSPQIDKNPGDFVAQGSRTAIRRFNRKIPRHSESHKLTSRVLLQLTGRREGDCNGASSVIFPCAAVESITEPASVTDRHGNEKTRPTNGNA